MQDWRTHDGVDIATELGAQVKALTNGTVSAIYDDDLYGTTIVIRHRGGLESVYCNLAATPTVSVGDQVVVGQVIGAVGDTALCETGEVCHLHFAMRRDGESVDPTDYLP
jgi:murein DD-endopeptidase MepM/ murein hydrolase activator NlpD